MVDEMGGVVSTSWVAASDSPGLGRPAWNDGKHALPCLPIVADPVEMDVGRGNQNRIKLVRKNFHLDQRHCFERVEEQRTVFRRSRIVGVTEVVRIPICLWIEAIFEPVPVGRIEARIHEDVPNLLTVVLGVKDEIFVLEMRRVVRAAVVEGYMRRDEPQSLEVYRRVDGNVEDPEERIIEIHLDKM